MSNEPKKKTRREFLTSVPVGMAVIGGAAAGLAGLISGLNHYDEAHPQSKWDEKAARDKAEQNILQTAGDQITAGDAIEEYQTNLDIQRSEYNEAKIAQLGESIHAGVKRAGLYAPVGVAAGAIAGPYWDKFLTEDKTRLPHQDRILLEAREQKDATQQQR